MPKKDRGVLVRAVKFEIFPQGKDLETLVQISANMCTVWNEGFAERDRVFQEYYAPLYAELKEARLKDTEPKAPKKGKKEKKTQKKIESDEVKEIKRRLGKAFEEHAITAFDQINGLTSRRADDEQFASVPRNWQEQTLVMLHGATVSFLVLRKNGDKDARPPRARLTSHFSEIYGRIGFKVEDEGGKKAFTLRPGSVGAPIRFLLPEYQSSVLKDAESKGGFAVKQFTLCRKPRDLSQPGQFFLSLVYEYARPEVRPDVPDTRVYIAVGASSLGVISAYGEQVIELWRPDKHWKPKIEAVEARMKPLTKGSGKWKGLALARRKMFDILAKQQRQHHAEVVQKLLTFGVHFVVTDHVVRSKEDALADHEDVERRGSLGLNWSAQNTGNIAAFVAQLQVKVSEHGGSVTKYKLALENVPRFQGTGHHNKSAMVRALRSSFIRVQSDMVA